jgi:predicted component of type VI protein secretion system
MLSRDSRQERKLKLLLRTQFRFKQGIERIDFEEDVLLPEIEKLKAGKSVLGLEDGAVFDIQIAHEDPDKNTSGDSK